MENLNFWSIVIKIWKTGTHSEAQHLTISQNECCSSYLAGVGSLKLKWRINCLMYILTVTVLYTLVVTVFCLCYRASLNNTTFWFLRHRVVRGIVLSGYWFSTKFMNMVFLNSKVLHFSNFSIYRVFKG